MKYDPSFNTHTYEQNLAEHEFINQTPKPPSTEIKKYRIKAKDASSWQSIHKDLIAFGTNVESIPQRTCTCANFRGQSETTGTYEISEEEALELRKNPNIKWVTLDPMYHEEARVPVEPTASNPTPDIQRFGKNVKNYRTLSSISKVTPVEVASSLDAVSGSPNWIKVSAAHPNTAAMNYWAVISSLLVDYAIYPSAPASASTQDPLRESLQSATNTVTLTTGGWYKIEVVADGIEAYLEVKDNTQNWYDQKPGYLIPLDPRGGGHRYDCFNLGYKAGGTTLDITYKVKNGTATDPNKRDWDNNPGGIGWRIMRIDMAAPNVANPSLHSWPYATSSSGIPAAETNRTGYQLKRCEAETTNPFGSNSLDILDADVTYKDDGMDVDCIIVDSGVWSGHPEFCTNENDPPNFIPGNVLNRSAKSGVLDLILDAPAYLDPEYWEQNPSYLTTRWDGTRVPTDESARDWWNDPSKRSSQYKSRYAPGATFSILVNPAYTRINNSGTDESCGAAGDHGTKCASLVYGKNFGWAFNCNKWSLKMAFGLDTGSPPSNNWEHQKIFHESKPDNPKFSGNAAKNKTVSSNSWGMAQSVYNSAKYWGCGYDFKINFRGTETTYTRNNTDVYGNSWTGTDYTNPSTYLPNPADSTVDRFPDMYQYANRACAVSNPYVTHIPACLRCPDGSVVLSIGASNFGYGWMNQMSHTAEQGENNAVNQADWDSAVESMNSGIYYVFAAGNDSNYIAAKNDPDYNNWATQANGVNIPGVGEYGGTESKHYFHRAAYPAGIMYEATGLNKAFVIGALDDQYKDSMVFSEDTLLNDYSNDAQGNSTEVAAHNGPYGRMYTTWYGAPSENPGFTATIDRPSDFGGGSFTAFNDRFTGWGGQKWAQYRRDYSSRGSGVDFWAPADSTLAASVLTGYGAGQDTVIDNNTVGKAGAFTIPRNDTKPGSGYYADGYMNGTSAACPVAAGLIACAMQQNRTTEAAHMGGYLSNSIPVDTNYYVGESPNSPDDPNWTGLHGNMGNPIRQIKEVEASKKHNNTPNPSLYANSGIDANRNLNERFTITSASGVTMMIRGIREFSSSDVSVPVSLRVVGGGSVGVRYYPIHTTNSLTSTQRSEIRFRIKSGSNDQILEVSNNSGSTWTYFTIRVVNGYFVVGEQGEVYYALNVDDDVSLPEDITPTYILTTNLLTVNEGSQLITTVQTTNVSENTTLYWSLSGTGITSGDFSSGSLTGQVSIAANGNAVFNHTLANDLSTEGTETINIKLFTDASRNTQVATANVNINDTSKGATYSIAPDKLSINEGETVRYTLTTTNVQDGTVLYTELTGISANDLSSGELQSSWSVFNNTFFSDYTLAEDSTTEGNEVITFNVYADPARTNFNKVASNSSLTVVDTSLDSSPSYSLSCIPTGSVNEGSNIVATVATTNVTTGTVLYWEISGTNITSADFTTSLTGSSSVNSSGNAVWTNTLANDVTTEGDETFNLKVYTDSGRTNQVASTWTQVIKDTSLGITYGIAAAKTSYNEGETMYAAVSTTNASVGSTLYWKIDPISNTLNASDFSGGLEGSGTLDSNGQFTFTRVISNDTTTEGNETFTLKLYTDSSRSNLVATSSTITIVDTSVDAPTYTISASPTSVDEGSSFTTTVTTTNVPENTTLYWALSGSNVDASDFSSGSLTGSGTITSNSFNFSHTLDEDATTEGAETVSIKLYSDSGRTVQVGSTVDVTINDTSQTPAVPSYSITPSKTSINEGETLTTTVTTSNVAQGTTLYWQIDQHTGNVTISDFSSGTWNGSDTISNNTITFSHTIAADATTEGEEKFAIILATDSGFANVVATSPTISINDTSQPPSSPTYVLSANTNPIDEGSSLIITATTTNVAANTTLYWSFSGTGIAAADFMEGTLEGTTIIPASGFNNWSTSIKADALTEGNETLLVKLFTDSARTIQVGNTLNVTINDTSTTPDPTYALNTNVSQVDEGGSWTTEVVTGNVAQGTTLYWSLSGTNLDASDFSVGALTGDGVTAANGTFTFSHTTSLDVTTEGDETAVIKLFTDSARTNQVATTNVLIKDTSESSGSPTYTLSTTDTRFNEGDSFTTTVTTTDVAEGTVLYWALSGTGVSEDDFNLANTTTGSGTITSNTFTFSHTIREDAVTEGDEVISIKLYINADRTIQVGNTLSVTVRDSSQPGYCIRVTAPSSAAYILTGVDRNGSI